MGIFNEIRNKALIRELERETNTDVLLFGFDGNTYFGNLQAVEDCRIAVLTGATEADVTDVEILTAGGELFEEATFVNVDLWTVVAKGTGVKSDPISFVGNKQGLAQAAEGAVGDRQESHDLICILRRMIGDNVAIATFGGFLFEGILGDVDDELAIIAVDDIFVPGTSSSITDEDVRTVVVNLEAITAVASTTTSRS